VTSVLGKNLASITGLILPPDVAAQITAQQAATAHRANTARALAAAGGNTCPASSSFSWVSRGKVSPVPDQGDCGSCWAFAASGAFESALLIAGQDFDVAEQQTVRCARNAGPLYISSGSFRSRAVESIP
jgi:hypothetical protein